MNSIQKMKQALEDLFKISAERGENIMHNYKWREIIQKDIMIKNGIDIKDVSGITGDDFSGKDVKKGDYKSSKGYLLKNGCLSRSTGKFEFDKQNDQVKRQETMKYDCLFFTWFVGTSAKASVLIKGEEAVKDFRKMATEKLSAFVKLLEEKQKEGKRVPRDSISFNYIDVVKINGARYFCEETEVTLKEFKQIFGE